MGNLIRPLVVIAIIYLTGCAANTTVREHPQLVNELARVNSVVVAPPEISIEEQNLDGENTRLNEREDQIRKEILEIASKTLTEKGFRVVEFDFASEISSNEEFAYNVNLVKEGYNEARKILYVDENKKDENENQNQDRQQIYTANVGPVTNSITQKTGADSILLVNYTGIKKSGGSVAKDIAVGVILGLLTGYAPVSGLEASYVEVALIDGESGDVLWSNYQNGQHVSSVIMTNTMYKFPSRNQKLALNKDQQTAQKVAD